MGTEETGKMRRIASEAELRALLEEIDDWRRRHYLPAHALEFWELIQRWTEPARWGLQPSRLNVQYVQVTLESDRCRMRLTPRYDELQPNTSSAYCMFGRLHAPDDHVYMDWQGERHVAWHDVLDAHLYWFLEGLSVEEAVRADRDPNNRWLPVRQKFMATDPGQRLHGMEWSLAYRGYILSYFGERLFRLFDLRQEERWEGLRRFTRRFYELQPDWLELKKSMYESHPEQFVPPWNLI